MPPKHPFPSNTRTDGDKLAKLVAKFPANPEAADYEKLLSKLREFVGALEASNKPTPPVGVHAQSICASNLCVADHS